MGRSRVRIDSYRLVGEIELIAEGAISYAYYANVVVHVLCECSLDIEAHILNDSQLTILRNFIWSCCCVG